MSEPTYDEGIWTGISPMCRDAANELLEVVEMTEGVDGASFKLGDKGELRMVIEFGRQLLSFEVGWQEKEEVKPDQKGVPVEAGPYSENHDSVHVMETTEDVLWWIAGDLHDRLEVMNERLHERTQGFLRRAAADKVGEAALHDRMGVAWRIINVLTRMDIDRAEPWPAALAWLEENEKYRPVAPVSTKEGA